MADGSTCPKCGLAVPVATLQLDSSGAMVCATCALSDLAADRKRSESRLISVGLLGVGVAFILAGLKFASGFQNDPSLMIGSLVVLCGIGACMLLGAAGYELYLRRRGQRHPGRIAEVANNVLEANMPAPTTVKATERVLSSASRQRRRK